MTAHSIAIIVVGGFALLILLITIISSYLELPTKPKSKYQEQTDTINQAMCNTLVAELEHKARIGTKLRNLETGRMKTYNEKHPRWQEGLYIQP